MTEMEGMFGCWGLDDRAADELALRDEALGKRCVEEGKDLLVVWRTYRSIGGIGA